MVAGCQLVAIGSSRSSRLGAAVAREELWWWPLPMGEKDGVVSVPG